MDEHRSTERARFEPRREDEVAAFKQALGTDISSAVPDTKAKLIKSWRHVPVPRADFADTQIQDTEIADGVEKTSPLSSTQYGDLN